MQSPLTLTAYIDGGSRGNPGPAAFAFIILHDGEVVTEQKGFLGQATNNVAEYTALIEALKMAAELRGRVLHLRSDSELLVRQMRGEYRVKNPNLLPLYEEAKRLVRGFERVDFQHVYREENREADRLCNEALDAAARGRFPLPKAAGAQEAGLVEHDTAAATAPAAPAAGGMEHDQVKVEIRGRLQQQAAGHPWIEALGGRWRLLLHGRRALARKAAALAGQEVLVRGKLRRLGAESGEFQVEVSTLKAVTP